MPGVINYFTLLVTKTFYSYINFSFPFPLKWWGDKIFKLVFTFSI